MGIGIAIAIGFAQLISSDPHPDSDILLESGDKLLMEDGSSTFLLE